MPEGHTQGVDFLGGGGPPSKAPRPTSGCNLWSQGFCPPRCPALRPGTSGRGLVSDASHVPTSEHCPRFFRNRAANQPRETGFPDVPLEARAPPQRRLSVPSLRGEVGPHGCSSGTAWSWSCASGWGLSGAAPHRTQVLLAWTAHSPAEELRELRNLG